MAGEWQETTIGEFCHFAYGKSLPARKRNEAGSIPVFGSGGLSGRHDEAIVEGAGIIIGRKGTVGSITYSSRPFWPIDTVFYVTNDSHRDLKFTYYLLKTLGLEHMNADSAVPGLNRETAHKVAFRLPPLPEQKAIAHVLGALDDKIELNRRMNETLEGMAQALFKSWFVDFDPVIDNALAAGNPIPEPLAQRAETRGQAIANGTANRETSQDFPASFRFTEELGWIPEGWEVGNIGQVADVIDCLHSKKPDQVNIESGNILLQLANIKDDGLLDLSSKYFISDEMYKKWTSRMEAKEGDFVITNVGRVGACSIIPRNTRAALGRNMTGIRLREAFNYHGFFQALLTSDYIRLEIEYRTDVGTILNALNVKNIPALRFSMAPQETLSAYEIIAQEILFKRQQNIENNQTLAKLRDVLLPKLISGELRIPQAEKMVEEAIA